MIRGRSFVVFSDDWGRHPSSSQHLFRRIAPENDVLWVNTIGTRLPELSIADAKRVVGKLKDWLGKGSGTDREATPVRVATPFMTPFDHWKPFRAWNAHLLTRAVRDELKGQTQPPVLVTTIPNVASVVGKLGESASIYYCVDEFSEWPGSDRDSMIEMERELLARVDMVVATSDSLFESKSKLHPKVHLLRHGVDWEHFHTGAGTVPDALRTIPGPRCGFTGLIDERIDTDLVMRFVNEITQAHFVFVGPRLLRSGPWDRHERIHFVDPIAYKDMPATLRAFDTLILPYRENDLTERINPLKLREFLASGVPIVATSLPEVKRYGEHLFAPARAEEWGSAIRAALREDPSLRSSRAECVRSEGWDRRAEEFASLLTDASSELVAT